MVGLAEAEAHPLLGDSRAGVHQVSEAEALEVQGVEGPGDVAEVGLMRGLLMACLPTLRLLARLYRELAMLLQSQLVPDGVWQVYRQFLLNTNRQFLLGV